MSIAGISTYQSQNIFAANRITDFNSSNKQISASRNYSCGDTVSISLESKQLLIASTNERESISTGLEDGATKIKMLGDHSYNPMTDVVYIPEAVASYMPKLSDTKMATLADLENYNKGLISDSEWAQLKQGVINSQDSLANSAKAMSSYKEAMRQLGIDFNDSNSLYAFSKDPDQIKAVDELFQKIMGS